MNAFEAIPIIALSMVSGAGCYHQITITQPPAVNYECSVEAIPEENKNEGTHYDTYVYEGTHYTDEEIDLLCRCVEAEAGNQSFDGKRMVADVVLNRVADPDWPDSIEGVISEKYEFSTYWNGAIDNAEISDETMDAVLMELENVGWPGIYYFTAEGYNEYGAPWQQVGDHYFSTK